MGEKLSVVNFIEIRTVVLFWGKLSVVNFLGESYRSLIYSYRPIIQIQRAWVGKLSIVNFLYRKVIGRYFIEIRTVTFLGEVIAR